MATRSLKALIRQRPGPADSAAISQKMASYPDRAVSIIMGAGIEDDLEDLVLARMRIDLSKTDKALLLDGDGVISRFSAKITVAFALGLIGPETRRDLTRIKDIRNAFAHARSDIDFSTPEISKKCSELELPERPRFKEISDADIARQPSMQSVREYYATYSPPTMPRARFSFTVIYLSSRLWFAWKEIMLHTDSPRPSAHVP
jgi:hypothetical protein